MTGSVSFAEAGFLAITLEGYDALYPLVLLVEYGDLYVRWLRMGNTAGCNDSRCTGNDEDALAHS
jgi:hypothetical protein